MKLCVFLFFVLIASPLFGQTEEAIDSKKISEAFGHLVGRNLHSSGFTFDIDSVVEGIEKAQKGEPSPMTDKEYEEAIGRIQERAYQALSKRNLSQSEHFLSVNRRALDVVEIEKGKLQYRIDKEGSRGKVRPSDTPLIHYTGHYLDGEIFDSSLESGPIALPLKQTIPGFSQGITGMKEGEKRTLYIHPDLAYATSGKLLPNALLIFEIELIKVNANDEDRPSQP